MTRRDQRQGFLVSAVVHLVLLTVLWSRPPASPRPLPPPQPAAAPARATAPRVFLPPPEVLRQLLPTPAPGPVRPPTPPPPAPAPPPARPKDRISIGPPSAERAKGPLILRREDDLTAVAKGRPDTGPSPATPAPGATATPASKASELDARRPGARLPPAPGGSTPPGAPDASARPQAPSIASSLKNLERRLEVDGARGLPTGTVKQMGPLAFDPQGADFTLWVNHFKTEVYRNWIAPQPALFGMRGHVDFEFTVDRDGTLRDLRLLKSSGTPAMDRAAQNALEGSRLLALPADYGPQSIQMQVTFFYNEGPQGS